MCTKVMDGERLAHICISTICFFYQIVSEIRYLQELNQTISPLKEKCKYRRWHSHRILSVGLKKQRSLPMGPHSQTNPLKEECTPSKQCTIDGAQGKVRCLDPENLELIRLYEGRGARLENRIATDPESSLCCSDPDPQMSDKVG